MAQTPIVRPVSWSNAAVTLVILVIFVLVGYSLDHKNGVIWGAVVFILASQILRRAIPRNHRRAIRYCKRQEFDRAIPEFHKSIDFFRRYEWIDRYRAVTILSAAGMWYREMGLASVGFCYAQIGDGENARRSYEQCLAEFPNNLSAKSALRLMGVGAK